MRVPPCMLPSGGDSAIFSAAVLTPKQVGDIQKKLTKRNAKRPMTNYLEETGVDDVEYAVDGEARLGDVGGHDDLKKQTLIQN